MDVAGEGLLAAVDHLHGAVRVQREQGRVDLHRDVLTAAERAADPAEMNAHALERQPEARRDLGPIDVQPLRCDMDVDPALPIRDGEPGLGPEERLVLDPRLVDPLDGDLAGSRRIAVADDERPHDVRTWILGVAVALGGAIRVQLGAGCRPLHLGDRVERLVVDCDLRGGAACLLGVVRGNDCNRLTEVPHTVDRKHGLVAELEAVVLLARHVRMGEYSVDAGHRNGLGDLDRADPRMRMRAP